MVLVATTTDPPPLPACLAALPAGLCADAQAAYAQPPRAYHHFGHVLEVAAQYDEVARGPGWMQPDEALLAVLFHDAVYEPGRGDNEARSAQLARAAISLWLGDRRIDADRVATLIEATARHGKLRPHEVDADAALFLDCDMAILGADPGHFDAYDAGIAREYRGRVPTWLFQFNRRRFLRGLLERERIFLSPWFHARLDAPARANLRRSLGKARDPLRAAAGR